MKRNTFTIAGHDFENEDIFLDFNLFESCTFKDCRLVVHGVGPFDLKNCTLAGSSHFVFGGGAQNTLIILKEMYRGGFKEIIEQTFEQIRGNNPILSESDFNRRNSTLG